MRGRERSIPAQEIVGRIDEHVSRGYKEVVLTGTQLGSYGFELPGIDLSGLMRNTREFVYSTTHSTNAILEGKVARTAFLTTRGYRDTLLYKEGGKDDVHNKTPVVTPPYVRRRLSFELTERVLSDGTVAVPLDEFEVRRVLERLRELDVEAIGVCLLWSPLNPTHEQRVAEQCRQRCQGV